MKSVAVITIGRSDSLIEGSGLFGSGSGSSSGTSVLLSAFGFLLAAGSSFVTGADEVEVVTDGEGVEVEGCKYVKYVM
jgi:hypothetical protein